MKKFPVIPFLALSVSSAVSAQQVVFRADYEDGTITSGHPSTGANRMGVPGNPNGVPAEPGLATAPDAAYVVNFGAHGTDFAVANKVTLDDPTYVGGGYPRSEFGFGRMPDASYNDGDHHVYTFSMMLDPGFMPSVKGARNNPSEDVVWQFKHHGGGHDLHLGLQGTKLRLGWGGNVNKLTLIDDVTPYLAGRWMDFRFDVLWKSDNTGAFTFDYKLPGETEFGHAVTRAGIQTYVTSSPDGTPWTGNGSIQYGVYRNAADSAAGDTKTLIVYHDEVSIVAVPEPGTHGLLGAGALVVAATLRRRRVR